MIQCSLETSFKGGAMIFFSPFFLSAPWNTDMMAGFRQPLQILRQCTVNDRIARQRKQDIMKILYHSWTAYLYNLFLTWKRYIILSCLSHCYFWIFLLQCIQSNPIPNNKWLFSYLICIWQYIVYKALY